MNNESKLAPPAKKRYAGGTYSNHVILRKNTSPMQVIFGPISKYATPSGEMVTANDGSFFRIPSKIILHTPTPGDSVITEIPSHNRFIPVQTGRKANNLNPNDPEWQIMKRRWNEAKEGKVYPLYKEGGKPGYYDWYRRSINLGNGRLITSEYMIDSWNPRYKKYMQYDFPDTYRGGRTIYFSPERNDTIYWNYPEPENSPFIGIPIGTRARNQEKAKRNFYRNVRKTTPYNTATTEYPDKNESQEKARRRALKGN